jgi:hypothetical protein
MNHIHRLLEMLQDTDTAASRFEQLGADNPTDDIHTINMRAIRKRRADLERRITTELRATQSDLIEYHVERKEIDRYPALAVAKAIAGFQELVTSVFDAIRTVPKQRYRPSASSTELSTLNFAMALPIGSVLVSMSVENDRLIAVKSDLDQTFERVFEILKTRESGALRELSQRVGIASIAKAHDWAASAAEFGLNTRISIRKDLEREPLNLSISGVEAQELKEVIEEKSDRTIEPEMVTGELIGIDVDVDPQRSFFHLKTSDGRNIQGKLDDTFYRDRRLHGAHP